jgi:hypothetical protein
MSYFLLDDLAARVGRDITRRYLDDDNDGTEEVANVLAIQDAVATYLETRLSRLYSIATLRSNPPATLRAIAIDIALMFMGERRPEFLDQNGKSPFSSAGARAIDLLKSIQNGDARLDVDDVPAKPGNVFGSVRVPSSAAGRAEVTDGFVRNGSGDF